MISREYREQLAEAFRAVDAGTITKTRERMDRRENHRRTHPGATPPYRPKPNSDRQRWLVVAIYAAAIAAVCWFTKRGL